MIIVENNQEISRLVEELNLGFGSVKLDEASLPFTQIYPNELYLIDAEILQRLNAETETKLIKAQGIICFGQLSQLVITKYPNLISVFTADVNKAVLRNQINLLYDMISQQEVMKSQLITLNTELAQTLGSLESELIRLKQANARKTPRRLEEIKCVNFYSKYSAGENMGGEYFDMFKSDNKVFMLMSSTSSYMASHSILTFFSALKQQPEITKQMEIKFLLEIREEIEQINRTKAKKLDAQILTVVMDLNTYRVSGHNLGQFKIKSSTAKVFPLNNQRNTLDTEFSDAEFDLQFHRGEKLMFLSPGFLDNWDKLNAEFMPEDILTKPGVKSLDILDELFFQMKKDSESGFLAQDASVILLEMGNNVMVKI